MLGILVCLVVKSNRPASLGKMTQAELKRKKKKKERFDRYSRVSHRRLFGGQLKKMAKNTHTHTDVKTTKTKQNKTKYISGLKSTIIKIKKS